MFSSYKPWGTQPDFTTIEDALNAIVEYGKRYFKFGIVEISEDEAIRFIKDYLSCNDHLGNPKDLDALNTEVEIRWINDGTSRVMHHIATMYMGKTREGNIIKSVMLSTCKCMYTIDCFEYLEESPHVTNPDKARLREYRFMGQLNILPAYKSRYQKREWK